MERRKGLKRDGAKARAFVERGRGSLSAEKPLTASVEKVREFMQRGREAGAQSLRASSRRRPKRPLEGPLTPEEWIVAVAKASDLRCKITNTRARDAFDPRFHGHHPLPKRELRARGLHAHVWDPRNGVWVLARLHEQHEAPGVRPEHRIARQVLPASVWEFCAELDAIDGTHWATELVRRLHPDRR